MGIFNNISYRGITQGEMRVSDEEEALQSVKFDEYPIHNNC